MTVSATEQPGELFSILSKYNLPALPHWIDGGSVKDSYGQPYVLNSDDIYFQITTVGSDSEYQTKDDYSKQFKN